MKIKFKVEQRWDPNEGKHVAKVTIYLPANKSNGNCLAEELQDGQKELFCSRLGPAFGFYDGEEYRLSTIFRSSETPQELSELVQKTIDEAVDTLRSVHERNRKEKEANIRWEKEYEI